MSQLVRPTSSAIVRIVLLAALSVPAARAADSARPLRYRPEGDDIVITNGKNHFNRPLYGGQSAFFVYASDVPELMLSLPGKGGTLWLGIISSSGSKWLHESETIVARYRAGAMRYEVRDKLLGPGTLTIDVSARVEAEGTLVEALASDDAAAVALAWAFGGASGFNNNKWDFDTARYCPESATLLRPEDCADNEFKITDTGFELRAPCHRLHTEIRADTPGSLTSFDISTVAKTMRPVIGVVPPDSEMKIANAEAVGSPEALWQSKAEKLPILMGRCAVEGGKPLRFAIEWLAEGGTPMSWADVPAAIRAAEAHRAALARRVRVCTPDPYLNAAAGAISVAADALCSPPLYMHGAVAWRMPLLGWRGAYIASEFGWHDRAQAHFRQYAQYQVQEPADGQPRPEPKYNLARQALDSVLYSRGHIPNAPVKGEKGQCDMQQVYVDQLLWHLQWTGDLDFARQMWPVLAEHFAWEKRCFDPDDDGLYENFANTMISDAHHYNGGPCAQASAYNYRALRLAARLAERLGEDPQPLARQAEKTLAAINRELWMPELGWYAEYRDLLGRKLLHPSAELPSVYHPIDSDVPDPFQAYQMLRYVDTAIQHIPVEGDSAVVWTSNWVPYIWSVRNVIPSETAHTALAYWQSGARKAAWNLFRGAIVDSMYASRVPGNCAGTSELDPRNTGAATDFNCTVAMYGRALVEGLFGIVPNLLDGELLIRPGLPSEWPSASIDTPDLGYTCTRQGSADRYAIRSRLKQPVRLRIRVAARGVKVAGVTLDGQPVAWKCVSSVGEPVIEVLAEQADGADIEIRWQGDAPAAAACPAVAGLGEPLVVGFAGAQVHEVRDPQGMLKDMSFAGNQLRATVAGQLGHRTAFARLQQGDLSWWAPIDVEVRPPVEICQPHVDWPNGQVVLTVRNNTDTPLDGPAAIQCGSAAERITLRIAPRSESAPVRLPAKHLVPGTNPIVLDRGEGRALRGAVVDWRPPDAAQRPALECVDLGGLFNDRVADIFKHEYRSPRSPCCSLQIPLHGFGDWCYGGKNTPTIDDAALRAAAGAEGRFVSPQGIPLATPGPGHAPNVIFTSCWDSFPSEVKVPLSGRARHLWLLVAGSTHPMQSQLDNGEIIVAYADGAAERLALRNPTTWWPIEADYDLAADGFCVPGPHPPRIDLGTGRAAILDLPLDPTRPLQSLTVRCLSNDVVVGLMSATLLRPSTICN